MKIKLIESEDINITANADYKLKPTLRPPSDMGRQVDKEYKKQTAFKQTKLKENTTDSLLSEEEKSIKKKLFKLSKMESLVHNDEKLSRIYRQMVEDEAEEKYGYHYNETIMNIIFNDHVLNNPQYLEKYKNAIPKQKKRRDKTGINQLIRKGEEKMDHNPTSTNNNADVNELFGLGSSFDTSRFGRQPDQVQPNDIFIFDTNSKKLIDIVPRENYMDVKTKYNDLYNKELVQLASPKNDYDIRDLKSLFKLPNIKFASKFDPLGEENLSEISSEIFKNAVDVSRERDQDARTYNLGSSFFHEFIGKPLLGGSITQIGTHKPKSAEIFEVQIDLMRPNKRDSNIYYDVISDNYDLHNIEISRSDARILAKIAMKINPTTKYKNGTGNFRIKGYGMGIKEINNETTDAVSSGSFSPLMQVDETTDSSSSGQYSTPSAWAKPGTKSRFSKRPAWVGGIMMAEGHNYITEPYVFIEYAKLVESFVELESLFSKPVGLGDPNRYSQSDPEEDKKNYLDALLKVQNAIRRSANIFDGEEYKANFNELLKDVTDEINTVQSGKSSTTNNPLDEHHLDNRQDMVDFILHHQPYRDSNELSSYPDNEIAAIYHTIENELAHHMYAEGEDTNDVHKFVPEVPPFTAGKPVIDNVVEVDKNYIESMKKDLIDTGKPASIINHLSAKGLEDKDGLFKDNFSTDESEMNIGDDDQYLIKLGKLLFPDLNIPVEELKRAAADMLRKFFKGKSSKEAFELLMSKTNTIQNDMNMAENYKDIIKKRLDESKEVKRAKKSFRQMTAEEKESFLKKVFKESILDAQPDTISMAADKEDSMKNDTDNEVGDKPFPQLNEDKKHPSMLNLDRVKKETDQLTKSDFKNDDALDFNKIYGFDEKKGNIHKAAVFPDPKDFYIEQDDDKVQGDMTSFAEIEKEKLKEPIGKTRFPIHSNPDDIKKKIELNRGAGMSDIVFDNKPSEKFEERMKKDMGEKLYKQRQEKMAYNAEASMYNKDTQPNQSGDKKEQDNKYEKKYNTESVTGVYIDDLGKRRFKEFSITETLVVENVDSTFKKLDLGGLGNSYTQKVKVDENFKKENLDFDFYIKNETVVKIKKNESANLNESFNKMKHLMNYKPSKYIGK